MPNLFLERSIEINVPAAKLWSVFTDPDPAHGMGGAYVSEWEVGSPISWKDAVGKIRTNGKILKVESGKLLKHNLLRDLDGVPTMTSVITYEFRGRQDGKTTLSARESFAEALKDKEFADAQAGWDAALAKLKAVAEG
jgi:uncharacterized protein YndB with AHSA1/START domain